MSKRLCQVGENNEITGNTLMSIKRSLQHFLQDRRGGITPMFALAIIPMVGFVGAAVDYSHANSVKAAMQAAADSTALMLSKDAATLTDRAASDQGQATISTRCSPAPRPPASWSPRPTTPPSGSQVVVKPRQRQGQLHGR